MDWTQEEMKTLLNKVLEMVGSKASYSVSRAKVQWDTLGIEGRDAKECEAMFNTLTGKIRKFRLFSEIIEEATAEVGQGYSIKFCQKNFSDFPKKPPTAMSLFIKSNEEKFKDVPRGKDYFRFLSQKWNDCPEEEKEIYKKKYLKKMKKYNKKMEEFKRNHPKLVFRGTFGTSSPRIPVPVLPNPITIFTRNTQAKVQAKNPELNATQLRTKCTAKYHKLSDRKKLKWILQAKDLLPDYKAQCEMYSQDKPEAKLKPPVLALSKGDQKILDKHEGRPEAPPHNFFLYFCKSTTSDPSLTLAERSKKLSQLYHDLSEQGQSELKQNYNETVQAYIRDFQEYYEALPEERKEAEQAALSALAQYQRIVEPKKTTKRKLPDHVETSPKRKKNSKATEPLTSASQPSIDPSTDTLKSPSFADGKKSKSARKKATLHTDTMAAFRVALKSPPSAPWKKSKSATREASSHNDTVLAASSSGTGADVNESSPSKQKPIKKETIEEEVNESLLSFSAQDPTGTQQQATEDTNEIEISRKTRSSQRKSSKSSKSNTAVEEIDDSLLSFSTPAASKKEKGKTHKNASPSSPQKKKSQENETEDSETMVDDALLSFFSPLRNDKPQEEQRSKSKKHKRNKKKV